MELSTRTAAADLERARPRLFGIAYRMLGDVQDAEDVVQEAYLRWQQAPRDDVRAPEGWLVTVVTRLAIDRLRHVAAERATYPGPWLPEPIAGDDAAPDREATRHSDLSMAFLVLLERLAPEERAAFVLREAYDADYDEIARVLGKREAAVRQMVHRARERVHGRARFAVPPEARARLLDRFLDALATDDREAMLAVLAPHATFTCDGGGMRSAARRIVHGADRVARMLLGIETKYGRPFRYDVRVVNGEPALVSRLGGGVFAVTFVEPDDGGQRIAAFYRVMSPAKLRRVQGV